MRRFTLLHVLLFACMVAGIVALSMWLYERLQPTKGATYFFYVGDSSGLPEGTEVKFHGLPVGQVVRVTLDEQESRNQNTPAFRVDFQINPQGERVFNLWSFEKVELGKETPLIGATVVALVKEYMPGGKTSDRTALKVAPPTDGLSDDLNSIVLRAGQAVDNANAAIRSVRASLEARPERLGDDRTANLMLVLQRDAYPLDYGAGDGVSRPTRVAAVLSNLSAAARSFASAGDSITSVARREGPMEDAFAKVGKLTGDLDDPNQPFLASITDLKKTTTSMREDFGKYGTMADRLTPSLDRGAQNAAQMLDTLKREPWRILWKSTKDYGPPSAPSPTPTRVVRPSPSPSPKKGGR